MPKYSLVLISVSLLYLYPGLSLAHNGEQPCPGSSAPVERAQGKGFQIRASAVSVFVSQGKKAVIAIGYNMLNDPVTVTCNSDAGCILTANSMVRLKAGASAICTFVDDQPIFPAPDLDQRNALASTMLSKGDHIVQTMIHSYNTGHAKDWEIDYTLYQGK